MNGYSKGDTISNAISFVYTKLMWKGARLVRRSFHIRNKKNFTYGAGFTCGYDCRISISAVGKLMIGKGFIMGDYNQIEAMGEIIIGNDVLLASRIYSGGAQHGNYKGKCQDSPFTPPNERTVIKNDLKIGNNVWIGNGCSILGSLGEGCIIGAGSVVTHDIPEYSIAVGNPAKVIKQYDSEKGEWREC